MKDLNKRCRLCGKRLRDLEARLRTSWSPAKRDDLLVLRCCVITALIGLCQPCHTMSFQIRRPRLPPIQHLTRIGWRGLPSAGDLERWRQWENEIIERLDRENETADLTD